MSKKARSQNRQPELFLRSKRPTVPIEENHRLVLLTDETDWTELEERVEQIRMGKLKSAAGRPPHLRTLIGALLLKATRDMTWREAEDLIRHYAPARYLCGLTETEWSPDHTTLHDFAVLLGEEGVKLINEYAVKWAVGEELADPSLVVADTTAQEAAIPYPNEMGLMAGFMTSVAGASKGAGHALKKFAGKAKKNFKAAKEKIREYRLFAKTKAVKDRMVAEMTAITEQVQRQLAAALKQAGSGSQRLTKHGKVARAKVEKLHETMKALTPQIRYWLRTGWVASDKVISLHIRELYSIVRGKVGKAVEFGLTWGITRLRGGYLLATVAKDRRELVDAKFAVRAVSDHIALFGKPPRAYAYDRGGYSEENVAALKRLGVEEVGLAPQGRAAWSVGEEMRKTLVKERALVEAGIGTVKSRRYGFNRPRARSAEMMGACGQLAILGFNLNKLVRELAKRNAMAVVG
ncbi:MAG TPA: transposase [Anaeromyxobacteraceae bacterium]|nr:transposase [Anaeromyxobacteraceae bacterium]